MTIKPLTLQQRDIITELKTHLQAETQKHCTTAGTSSEAYNKGCIDTYSNIITLLDELLSAKVTSCDDCPDHLLCPNAKSDISMHCGMLR